MFEMINVEGDEEVDEQRYGFGIVVDVQLVYGGSDVDIVKNEFEVVGDNIVVGLLIEDSEGNNEYEMMVVIVSLEEVYLLGVGVGLFVYGYGSVNFVVFNLDDFVIDIIFGVVFGEYVESIFVVVFGNYEMWVFRNLLDDVEDDNGVLVLEKRGSLLCLVVGDFEGVECDL